MSRFITVEGGEGVGKSTFIKQLHLKLQDLGIDVDQTQEPGGTELAQRLRELFVRPPADESWTIEAEFCVISAARAQHVKYRILPALAASRWVISDRYADSSRVYQGAIGGIDRTLLEDLIKLTTFAREPDLTFLLDCSSEISMQRVGKRAKRTKEATRYDLQEFDFHNAVRQNFLRLSKEFPQRFCVINAENEMSLCIATAIEALRARAWIV